MALCSSVSGKAALEHFATCRAKRPPQPGGVRFSDSRWASTRSPPGSRAPRQPGRARSLPDSADQHLRSHRSVPAPVASTRAPDTPNRRGYRDRPCPVERSLDGARWVAAAALQQAPRWALPRLIRRNPPDLLCQKPPIGAWTRWDHAGAQVLRPGGLHSPANRVRGIPVPLDSALVVALARRRGLDSRSRAQPREEGHWRKLPRASPLVVPGVPIAEMPRAASAPEGFAR